MDDLISREAVKKWLERWAGYIDMDIIRRMQYRVIDIPSTQSDRKNGKWIKISRSWLHDDVQCSECGNMLDMNGVNAGRGDANFCPNCGCRMESENE